MDLLPQDITKLIDSYLDKTVQRYYTFHWVHPCNSYVWYKYADFCSHHTDTPCWYIQGYPRQHRPPCLPIESGLVVMYAWYAPVRLVRYTTLFTGSQVC